MDKCFVNRSVIESEVFFVAKNVKSLDFLDIYNVLLKWQKNIEDANGVFTLEITCEIKIRMKMREEIKRRGNVNFKEVV